MTRNRIVFVFGLCAILNLLPTPATAAEAPKIIRVEEDWVVYVSNPDAKVGAPQIVNVIAPQNSTVGPFGIVELNHGSEPNFQSGGYQIQSWVGDTNFDFEVSEETNQLVRNYDKLRYTVAMELLGDRIRFVLKDGRSRTWGRFATGGITADSPATATDLSKYDPQFSVDNTTINVGAHRVELMYQQETRYYSVNGLERTDQDPRVLHRYQEKVQFVSLEEYEKNEQYFNIEITE